MQIENVIVLGSGPAGLTAALYTARADLNPLVIAGDQVGGQIAITSEVENYPGFPDGLTGPELVERFVEHAKRFGARIEYDLVTEVDFTQGPPYTVKTQSNTYQAWSVIITMGASPKRLGVPGEEEYIGRGVSYCGTCDGFFFRDKDIVVVGGGDSAMEEGLFLTKFAENVRVIHRRDELRAGPFLTGKAMNHPKIDFTWDTVVEEVEGDQAVSGVRVKNVKTGEESTLDTDGVFIFIGHYPNTAVFKDQLDMDEAGYLLTDDHMQTSVPGVFAAGEIQDPVWRQIATSVGQGTAAAMACTRWLETNEEEFEGAMASQAAG